jgi:DinB superfamily
MNEHDEVRMLDSERNSLLTALNKGREALTQAVEGVDEDLAARKPAVGGWSILECVNHIVESERYLLSRLHIAQQSNESFADGEREAKIAARAANRARKIEAPSESQPRNRYATLQSNFSKRSVATYAAGRPIIRSFPARSPARKHS